MASSYTVAYSSYLAVPTHFVVQMPKGHRSLYLLLTYDVCDQILNILPFMLQC